MVGPDALAASVIYGPVIAVEPNTDFAEPERAHSFLRCHRTPDSPPLDDPTLFPVAVTVAAGSSSSSSFYVHDDCVASQFINRFLSATT